MYKIYSVFILSLIAIIYFMAEKEPDQSALEQPSNILPLTFINLGDSCIKPSKIETESWLNESKLLSGGITFLAELHGDQVFMCPIKIPSQENGKKSFTLPNDENCTYPIKFKEVDPLRCNYEPEPVVQKLEMKTGFGGIKDVRCGPGNRGKMYRIVYEICMTDREIPNEKSPEFCNLQDISIKYRSEFEVFRFCYDERRKYVIHTEHKILSPGLLSHRKLKQEREKVYEMMIDDLNYFGLDSQAMKNKHDRLENYYEQKEIPRDQNQNSKEQIGSQKSQFRHQTLVPHDDFAFALWRKPTYHYFNFKLMREELIELWDHINKKIRYDAIRLNREYYIHTGAYEKSIDDIKSKTNAKKSSETPDIWLKIVYYFGSKAKDASTKTQAIAIIMDTNFDNGPGNIWFYDKCLENLCLNAFAEQYPQTRKSIRCCSVIDNQTIIESDIKVDEDLNLDFLYEDAIRT